MTTATRAMIRLAIENDGTITDAAKAALLACIDGNGERQTEEVLPIPEVARRLHKTVKTIHDYCRQGVLRKVVVGKQKRSSGILASSVDALLKGGAA